jgi:hypothetical protein
MGLDQPSRPPSACARLADCRCSSNNRHRTLDTDTVYRLLVARGLYGIFVRNYADGDLPFSHLSLDRCDRCEMIYVPPPAVQSNPAQSSPVEDRAHICMCRTAGDPPRPFRGSALPGVVDETKPRSGETAARKERLREDISSSRYILMDIITGACRE